jgi:hypothetical protein
LYVLWVIGELPLGEEERLTEFLPFLRRSFSASGDTWQEVVASGMELSEEISDEIRGLWRYDLEIARRSRTSLTPQHFAEMIVDKYFADVNRH